MKPFDLELAKQGHPVCTRDGRDARIVCFDRNADQYPIVVLVKYDSELDLEHTMHYTSEGAWQYRNSHELDLFMKSITEKRWIVYFPTHGLICPMFHGPFDN